MAVIDATTATAARQAQALAGFVRDGLNGDPGAGQNDDTGAAHDTLSGETLIFYADGGDKRRLVDSAPTRAVRLIRTTAWRPELMADTLAGLAQGGEVDLFLVAGGPTGTELATRLACRSGGGVLTDVLNVEVDGQRLRARRTVYSNHLVGRFELVARPWCVSIDASWNDAASASACAVEHDVLSDTDATGAASVAGGNAFDDPELVRAPAADDLAASRFLVVAGYGAGSRDAVLRIAGAARRMGADFGVSRPVVMNAWAAMDRLVGVSGARAAPLLCIVVGASGAPALQWGIERAAFIVAINLDEHAPIVADSDVALLDDGVAVIEALAEIVAGQPTHV